MELVFFPIYLFSVLLFWQYIALRLDKFTKRRIVRPTILINLGTKHVKRFWFQVGRFFAYVSSFYVYLGLGDLLDAFSEISDSIWNLSASFFYFIKGYLSVCSVYHKPQLLIWGSVTLITAVVLALVYYFDCHNLVYNILQDPTIVVKWLENYPAPRPFIIAILFTSIIAFCATYIGGH